MLDYRIISGIVLVLLVALLVLGRRRAQRLQTGARLELVGDQPEVGVWLSSALQAVRESVGPSWSFEILTLNRPEAPPETRAEVHSATAQAVVTVRVDSSRPSGTFTPEDPVRVVVWASSTPPSPGLIGWVFGAALTPAGRMQARVVRAIRRCDNPPPSLKPSVVDRLRARGLQIVSVAVLIGLVAMGVVAVRNALTDAASTTARTTASPSPTKKPTAAARPGKPKGAEKACAVEHTLSSGPRYSAVNAKTTCGFAENIRKAYVQSKANGKEVKLGKVNSPERKRTYNNIRCAEKSPVICRGGDRDSAKVWLYG